MEPKSILCFGDSNTWGMAPDGSGRLPFETRWSNLLQQILNHPPMIVLVTPGVIQTTPQSLAWGFKGATGKSLLLPSLYRNLAEQESVFFFDIQTVAETSPLDGVHFGGDQQHSIAAGLADLITAIPS